VYPRDEDFVISSLGPPALWRAFFCSLEYALIWYVKHRLRDETVETFRCNTKAKAQRIRRDLEEVGEVAWVHDEGGRTVPEWDVG
jgi:hypothetical protein